jgi:hypothetical protein
VTFPLPPRSGPAVLGCDLYAAGYTSIAHVPDAHKPRVTPRPTRWGGWEWGWEGWGRGNGVGGRDREVGSL